MANQFIALLLQSIGQILDLYKIEKHVGFYATCQNTMATAHILGGEGEQKH